VEVSMRSPSPRNGGNTPPPADDADDIPF
jgi:hypothetical protein